MLLFVQNISRRYVGRRVRLQKNSKVCNRRIGVTDLIAHRTMQMKPAGFSGVRHCAAVNAITTASIIHSTGFPSAGMRCLSAGREFQSAMDTLSDQAGSFALTANAGMLKICSPPIDVMTYHQLDASPGNLFWGYFDAATPAVLTVDSGDTVKLTCLPAGLKSDQITDDTRIRADHLNGSTGR